MLMDIGALARLYARRLDTLRVDVDFVFPLGLILNDLSGLTRIAGAQPSALFFFSLSFSRVEGRPSSLSPDVYLLEYRL